MEKTTLNVLGSDAFSHSLGRMLASRPRCDMSVRPSRADMVRLRRHVRFVLPGTDICNTLSTCGNKRGRIDAIPFDVTPGSAIPCTRPIGLEEVTNARCKR